MIDAIYGPRLGPRDVPPPTDEDIAHFVKVVTEKFKEKQMHYRNGRPALQGDKIVKLEGGKVVSFGVLHSTNPSGGDYCNGNIAIIQQANDYACLVDCLHIEDVAAILAEKGLDKRPAGK